MNEIFTSTTLEDAVLLSRAILERLVRLEGKADEIHDAGLTKAFRTHAETAPMRFFIAREIYSHLERVVDRFEDVANEIDGLVIIPAGENLQPGEFARVRITDCDVHDLYAEPL